jgi:hypothetical protein
VSLPGILDPPSVNQPTSILSMGPTLKRNGYFQTAVLDPNKRKRSLPDPPAMDKPKPKPKPVALTTIVGTDPAEQRTWTLPLALFSRSPYLATLARNPPRTTVRLPDVDPRDFATYIMYLYSGIYTLNPQVPNFRPLHAATRAHLLGLRLHDSVYADAAIRQIHAILLPLARLRTSNAAKSPIRASDIEYVGERAKEGSAIRRLFVDAVTSHWAQGECWGAGHVKAERPGEVKWIDVLAEYSDLRRCLVRTRIVSDRWRGSLLDDVEKYLSRRNEEKEGIGRGLHPDLIRKLPFRNGRLDLESAIATWI